jgi:hypothetical protein
MSHIVYRIQALLEKILANVPVGTNLGLMHLLLTILSGRLLTSRGALFPALDDFGLEPDAVRRANAALCYGRFQIDDLVANWNKAVEEEGHFAAHSHEGIQPVPADMTGFFRPQLQATIGKHYHSQSEKALPAISLGMIAKVGSVGPLRLATIRAIVCQEADDLSQKALRQLTVQRVKELLQPRQAAILDAEFTPEELLAANIGDFVVRGASNFAARRNFLADYKGVGRPPEYGEIVRPLARIYKDKEIAATPWDEQTHWKVGKRKVKAYLWNHLVPEGSKPGGRSLRCVVIVDPKYKRPLLLVTTLWVTAYAVWCLYTDRWPIEQIPLCAKQMLGAVRSFVFSKESRVRLPALALLAGNVLSYVAASSPAVATGFWDRCVRPTCGRLRRVLLGLHFRDLAVPAGRIRKKESVTEHLPKGVLAHRRQKAVTPLDEPARKAA